MNSFIGGFWIVSGASTSETENSLYSALLRKIHNS